MIQKIRTIDRFIGALQKGDDLLQSLTQICNEKKIQVGTLTAIGAVENAVIGYYDQASQQYNTLTISTPMEIAALSGNISLKAGQPFIHAHIVLAGKDGRCMGGHLLAGTTVFACEFEIQLCSGATLNRLHDDTTGLALWSDSPE